MGLYSRSGWGFKTALVGVSSTVAGVNVVTQNVGVGVVVQAAGQIRLTKILWRIDLAPDVAVGTVAAPVRYRIVVLSGSQVPPDVTIWQRQDFNSANSAMPDIASSSPLEVLFDIWLDLSAGDPGLNVLAAIEFPDAGPSVPFGSSLIVLLVPIVDAQMAQAPLPANGTLANAQLTLAAFGCGANGNGQGGSGGAQEGKSIPRYDVSVGAR